MANEKRTERKERIPVNGARDILTVRNKDPNYEYRWVLDIPGRLIKFQDGGWEVVSEDLEVGQKAVDSPSKVGSAITKNMGGNKVGVLMRIPREWYNEDQMAKQDKVDALEASMQEDLRQGRIPGTRESAYIPDGGGLQTSVSRGRK
jgi:hypothetical protein